MSERRSYLHFLAGPEGKALSLTSTEVRTKGHNFAVGVGHRQADRLLVLKAPELF